MRWRTAITRPRNRPRPVPEPREPLRGFQFCMSHLSARGACLMSSHLYLPERRLFLSASGALLASSFFTVRGAYAEELTRTPRQTEGPFYPIKLPLDTDNDLIIINDSITPAVGEITHLGGRILSASGEPLRNALVEIWQVDHNGAYLHTRTGNRDKRD